MKQARKRVLSMLAACAMAASLLALPAEASGSCAASTGRADQLASLHLFQGTASGYNLDATPTRLQGLIMLIRLLGLEDAAKACTEATPFTDTTSPYVAYAYANGITRGASATTFNPGGSLTASNYVTFLLRALGYDDSKGDFNRSQQMSFAAGISLMDQDAAGRLPSVTLNRGDMVDLSYAALTCRMNGQQRTLAEKLRDDGVFTTAEGAAAGVLEDGAGWVYTYEPHTAPAPAPTPAPAGDNGVSYERKAVSIASGSITASILTVDTKNPHVSVKTALVNNTVGATAPFKQIVQNSGAYAAINGNFFASYSDFKAPIGHVMVDGQFLYGNSGVSSLGITRSGDIRVGRPAVFTRIQMDGASGFWAAYEINTAVQDGSVLYTPAFGATVTVKNGGSILTVAGGVITGFQPVAAGTAVAIPANGYVVYMDSAFTSTNYFIQPVVGSGVSMEYYLHSDDPEGFVLDDMVSIVSGAPRLVQDGAMVTTLEPGFTEARFTTNSSPRTAIGVNAAGRLVMVSVPSATIQQMRELMVALGCVDAFNLDGGASCGMYHNGTYVSTPGRELTVTLQVFVNP